MIMALFVANYIIEHSNKMEYPINNLKLQKLLYFINARSLVETGNPIFEEKMKKWKYGPVVPNVYHEYKQYGAFNIANQDILETFFRFDNDTVEILEYSADLLSDEEKQLIETTVDALADYGAFNLVDITHKHDLWKCDENRILEGEQGISYNNEEVIDYFESHPEEQIWYRNLFGK